MDTSPPPSYAASSYNGPRTQSSKGSRPSDPKASNSNTARDAPIGSHPSKLRIACVQFDPKLMQVEANIRRVKQLTDDIPRGSVDLLLLPEMALTGYMFRSREEIETYLEEVPQSKQSKSSHPSVKDAGASYSRRAEDGPSLSLYRDLATRIGCYVLGGLGERVVDGRSSGDDGRVGDEASATASSTTAVDRPAPPRSTAYNSALLVSPTGELVGTYRKTFLYETDKTWASEGAGFGVWDLPAPIGRLVVGICMDLNPRDFIAPWDAYELAKFASAQRADVIAMPMNWLASEQAPESSEKEDESDNDGPSMSTLNYWAHRLMPLHDPAPSYATGGDEGGRRVTFVACNRTGRERETRFAGSSAVLTMSSKPTSRVELVEALGRDEEGVLLAEVVKRR